MNIRQIDTANRRDARRFVQFPNELYQSCPQWVPSDISNENCRFETNAAWIRVDWTSQPVSEVDVERLAQNASNRNLRYLYPFTTYVKSDGLFSSSYAYAPEFVSEFRRFNDETRLLAWIGIPLEWVDLTDENTRQQIIASVVGVEPPSTSPFFQVIPFPHGRCT